MEDDEVPFSEAINPALFSSMHRAPATVTSLVYGLALVTLPLVPKVEGLRARLGLIAAQIKLAYSYTCIDRKLVSGTVEPPVSNASLEFYFLNVLKFS